VRTGNGDGIGQADRWILRLRSDHKKEVSVIVLCRALRYVSATRFLRRKHMEILIRGQARTRYVSKRSDGRASGAESQLSCNVIVAGGCGKAVLGDYFEWRQPRPARQQRQPSVHDVSGLAESRILESYFSLMPVNTKGRGGIAGFSGWEICR